MPTKELRNSLINIYSILDGGKYFDESESQSGSVFQPFFRYATSKNGKIGSW